MHCAPPSTVPQFERSRTPLCPFSPDCGHRPHPSLYRDYFYLRIFLELLWPGPNKRRPGTRSVFPTQEFFFPHYNSKDTGFSTPDRTHQTPPFCDGPRHNPTTFLPPPHTQNDRAGLFVVLLPSPRSSLSTPFPFFSCRYDPHSLFAPRSKEKSWRLG